MAIFRCVITKGYNGKTWTNTYHVDAASLAAAHAVGLEIVPIEADIHGQFVEMESLRTSTITPNDDQYIVQPLIGNGERSVAGNPMPLYVTGRVDFAVAIGRPSRKYLRGVLYESDVEFETLGVDVLLALNAYGDALVAIDEFVDVDGQDIIDSAAINAPQMRQLRRGSKRQAPTP